MDFVQANIIEPVTLVATVCYEAFVNPKYEWDFSAFLMYFISFNQFLIYTLVFMMSIASVYDVYLAGLFWFEYDKDNLEDVTRSYTSRQRDGGDSFDNFDDDFDDF